MESLKPLDIVDAYLDAAIHFDYARARTYLADEGFQYVGPINQFQSADEFIAYAELASPIVQRVVSRKVFVNGNDVCHIFNITSQISEKRSNTLVQWANVQDGKIKYLEMIFDAHEYKMLYVLDK